MSTTEDAHEDGDGDDRSRHDHRRRHHRRPRSDDAKWRRLRWVALLLATVAVAWLLTLGTILVTRSGHTVSNLTGLVENGQQQRSAAVRDTRDAVRRGGASAERWLADGRRVAAVRLQTAAAAASRERIRARRLSIDLRGARARIRLERAERRSLVREIQLLSYPRPGAPRTRPELEAVRHRLVSLEQRLGDAREELAELRSTTTERVPSGRRRRDTGVPFPDAADGGAAARGGP